MYRRSTAAILFCGALMHAEAVPVQTGNQVLLQKGADKIQVSCVNDQCIELVYLPAGKNDSASPVISPAFHAGNPFTGVTIQGTAASAIFSRYRLDINESTAGFTVVDAQKGTLLTVSDFTRTSIKGTVAAGPFYGIVAHGAWDNGPTLTRTGSQQFRQGDQGHGGAPFFWTPGGVGILCDANGGDVSISGTGFTLSRGSSQRQANAVYVLCGTPADIYRSYFTVTGFPPLPPLHALGFIHSEWGPNESQLRSRIAGYRQRGIPIDMFSLDFEWMAWGEDNYGEFRWNTTNFPTAMSGVFAKDMTAQGIRFMGIRKPRVHLNTAQGNYCKTNGLFDPNAYGTDYFSNKPIGCVDFNKKAARDWWWKSFADPQYNSYDRGIVACWNDEPGYGGDFLNLHWQQANYEGQRAYNNQRVFSVNRSYFAGAHRYAYAHWTGDINSDWTTFQNHGEFMLSAIDIGETWWTQDIGGFNGRPSDNLYLRWMQMGAFTPIFRVHSSGDDRTPWSHTAVLGPVTDAMKLRYSLLPYIYAAFRKLSTDGLPPVRPLIMDYPADASVQNTRDSWMFGDALLVKPVFADGVTSMPVYLPGGSWFDFATDEKSAGPVTKTVSVTVATIPLYVKAGAIVPRRPPGRFSGDSLALDSLRLHVYAGADGAFDYYEDDFGTYEYEKGTCFLSNLRHTSAAGTEQLTLQAVRNQFQTRIKQGFVVFHGITFDPVTVVTQSGIAAKVGPAQLATAARPCWAGDTAKKTVTVAIEDPLRDGRVAVYNRAVGTVRPGSRVGPRISCRRTGQAIQVRADAGSTATVTLVRHDLQGRIVDKRTTTPGATPATLPFSRCARGAYFWHVAVDGAEAGAGLCTLK